MVAAATTDTTHVAPPPDTSPADGFLLDAATVAVDASMGEGTTEWELPSWLVAFPWHDSDPTAVAAAAADWHSFGLGHQVEHMTTAAAVAGSGDAAHFGEENDWDMAHNNVVAGGGGSYSPPPLSPAPLRAAPMSSRYPAGAGPGDPTPSSSSLGECRDCHHSATPSSSGRIGKLKGSGNGGSADTGHSRSSPGVFISRLSHMSMFLSSLRDSPALNAHNHNQHGPRYQLPPSPLQPPLLDDSAVELVANWLLVGPEKALTRDRDPADNNGRIHGAQAADPPRGQQQQHHGGSSSAVPGPSSMPRPCPIANQSLVVRVLTASHQLLDILGSLQQHDRPSNDPEQLSAALVHASLVSPTSAHGAALGPGALSSPADPQQPTPPPHHAHAAAASLTTPSSSSAAAGGGGIGAHHAEQHFEVVIKRLVAACDTLLLEVYLGVLLALQREAQQQHRVRQNPPTGTHFNPWVDLKIWTQTQKMGT